MINKFKNWLQKLKNNKSDSSDIHAEEHDIDLDAQIPDEEDIELEFEEQTPSTPPQVLTKESLQDVTEEKVLPPQEDLEYPDVDEEPVPPPHVRTPEETSDATGEISVMTNEVESLDATDATNEVAEFDLSQDMSFKDKVGLFAQRLKDRVQRIDFRKFKNFKFPTRSQEGKEDGPSLTQQLAQKYNVKIPKSVEDFEKKIKKFPWQNLHNEVFYGKNRTAINKTFLLLLCVLTPYYAGKSLGLLLKGKPDYKNLNNNVAIRIDRENELTLGQLADLRNAKLFKTEKVETDNKPKPTVASPEVCKTATKKSNLPIKLVNTVVLQDSVKSIASVQVRNQELNDVREGEKIDNMAKVDKIDRLGIIVKNLKDGTCESIDNTQMAGYQRSPISVMSKKASKAFIANKKIDGIENEGNTFKIQKNFLKEKMKNISDVLTQARGIQIPNPDGSMSFKIVDVEPGGIFAYLGIQDNDVITHIDGKKINDLNEVMSLFGKITSLDQLNITVSRGGEEVPLEYKLQ